MATDTVTIAVVARSSPVAAQIKMMPTDSSDFLVNIPNPGGAVYLKLDEPTKG